MLLGRPFSRALRSRGQTQLLNYSAKAESQPETLIYPDSPNSEHHDLPSFLEYASRNNLDPKSTTYVGTHYEYTVKTALEQLTRMSLKRIGGRSDCGIDLLGTWPLPSRQEPFKIIAQCKALARKIDPSKVRELEGAFTGAPAGWRGPGVIGLLITQKEATKGVREAFGRSNWPMGYLLCDSNGRIQQMLWNQKAGQEGLAGFSVELKYRGGDRSNTEVVLVWKGGVFGQKVE